MQTDTIAAIATAMTNSGIGVIRISGEDAFTVIDRIYRSKNRQKKLSNCDSHTIHYGFIYDGEELIDEVMVLLMRAPNSYTREDTVEIDCHGGVLVMKKILETVLKYGVRPADPGEFTKRAFLNGRIDLAQAESVMDVISSKNDFAWRSSMQQLKGALTDKIRQQRQIIIHEIAYIESALDDPEHISLDGYGEELLEKMKPVIAEVEQLITSFDHGSMLREGIDTVIVGKPNAGKSSLMNALLKKDRAIVTDIAGTTRDILEESIQLNGISLNIKDTAGIRDTMDVVERIGVDKAKSYLEEADLILYVVDASVPLDENDAKIMELISGKKCIVLLNKSDLISVVSEEDISGKIDSVLLSVSAREGNGIPELEEAITDLFFHGEIAVNDEIFITNIRHKQALVNARDSLNFVKQSIHDGMPEDFYSIDLMNAYEELGNIIGEAVEEDLVNEIFSKFCMGK